MRRYVTISAGRCASEAVPVVSSSDPEVVEAALRAIQARLTVDEQLHPGPVSRLDDPALPNRDSEADAP